MVNDGSFWQYPLREARLEAAKRLAVASGYDRDKDGPMLIVVERKAH
jgi:hypothetical protein